MLVGVLAVSELTEPTSPGDPYGPDFAMPFILIFMVLPLLFVAVLGLVFTWPLQTTPLNNHTLDVAYGIPAALLFAWSIVDELSDVGSMIGAPFGGFVLIAALSAAGRRYLARRYLNAAASA